MQRKGKDLKKGIAWWILCVWIGSLVLGNNSMDVMSSSDIISCRWLCGNFR